MTSRYDANIAAFGDKAQAKQQLLHNNRITILGNTLTAQYAIANLIGLGVGTIQWFKEPISAPILHSTEFNLFGQKLNSNTEQSQEQIFQEISPGTNISVVNSRPLDFLIRDFEANYIIDTRTKLLFDLSQSGSRTNDVLKEFEENIKYVSTNASNPLCVSKTTVSANACLFPNYGPYSTTIAALCGTIAADEIRKSCFLFSPYEHALQANEEIIIDLETLIKKTLPPTPINASQANQKSQQQLPPKYLVIGAGGIGTYCTLAIAASTLEPTHLTIVDPDVIEETNLNRQLWYSQHIDNPKAEILSQVIRQLNPQIDAQSHVKAFSDSTADAIIQDNKAQPYTAIFCCTDNYASRLVASRIADKYNIPLIEGGCSSTSGSVSLFVPQLTPTIEEQRDLVSLTKNEQATTKTESESCTKNTNPSIISTNCAIGTLMASYINLLRMHNSSSPNKNTNSTISQSRKDIRILEYNSLTASKISLHPTYAQLISARGNANA